jgi:hypothetical protein
MPNSELTWIDGALLDRDGRMLAWIPRLHDGFAACVLDNGQDHTLQTGLSARQARNLCREWVDEHAAELPLSQVQGGP